MLHGHRYVVEATFAAEQLDELGRVIDFGIIKERLGAWLDEHWDHNTILNKADKALGNSIAKATAQAIYYLDENPTAEIMADYLLNTICPKLFTDSGITCTRIRLYETPNCYADAVI